MTFNQLEIQISIDAKGWASEEHLETLARSVLSGAFDALKAENGLLVPDQPSELSIVFTNDATIADLNRDWRDKPQPTNVLSFPGSPIKPGVRPGPMLGDIVLAFETINAEAMDLDIDFQDHLSHLIVHGFLHLFGYDHLNDEEAEEMESMETRILTALGLSDPYRDTIPI